MGGVTFGVCQVVLKRPTFCAAFLCHVVRTGRTRPGFLCWLGFACFLNGSITVTGSAVTLARSLECVSAFFA